jgi:hypothetical protein
LARSNVTNHATEISRTLGATSRDGAGREAGAYPRVTGWGPWSEDDAFADPLAFPRVEAPRRGAGLPPSVRDEEHTVSLAPIEIIVIGFPENNFTGEIAPALIDLVESGTVRIADLVFVAKDADGNVGSFEVAELDDTVSAAYVNLVDELDGLIGEEDIEDFGAELEPNSSIALLVVEHLWAKDFADAVATSGGVLLDSIRIPRDVVDALTA